MWAVGLWIVALITIFISHRIYRWRNPKCSGILPPGTSGLPFIGETLQLIIPDYSLDVPSFIKKRLLRYGPIFRTNVGCRNVVISADPEFNQFMFRQEEKLVEHWYLDLFAKLFNQGESRPDGLYVHKYVRSLALAFFGPECLKDKLLSQLQQLVQTTLHSWSIQHSVEVKAAAADMFLLSGGKLMFSYDVGKLIELRETFVNFTKNLLSFPLNLPGTPYRRCFQGKKRVMDVLLELVKARLSKPESQRQGDLLDHILQDMKTEKFLTHEFIVQLLFGMLFVSFDSISWILALAIKLLTETPSVLKELIAEHEEILRRRETTSDSSSITWTEYKSMSYTLQVINETLRLGSVTPGLLRRAKKDIQVNGFTIPAGWAIMAANTATQLDPDKFPDPLAFNPSRWKDLQSDVIYKNFIPFGGGMKHCAGAEYTRASLSIFLHVLVTKYKWTKIRGGDVVRNPVLRFKQGLYIKVSEKA